MKRLLVTLLVVAGLVTVAHAATAVYVASGEAQSLTRASPRVDAPLASEKISLLGVKKIRASICSCNDSACTPGGYPDPGPSATSQNGFLTGGVLDVWYQHPDAGWMENPDLRLTVGAVDGGCRTWSDIPSPGGNSRGYAMAAARGVTLGYTDAGNFVKVFIEGMNNE